MTDAIRYLAIEIVDTVRAKLDEATARELEERITRAIHEEQEHLEEEFDQWYQAL